MSAALRLVPAAAVALLLAVAGAAQASARQESMFQDDDRLISASDATVTRTLDELERLGVDRLRITVVWRAIAPSADSDRRPDFDAANPDAYPAGSWNAYDRVLREAAERGIGVNFNVTAPAPDWATPSPARTDLDDVWMPDAREFGRFVRAVGTRYDGRHGPARVDFWSIYNEPNQPGWLSPQWVKRGKRWYEAAPRRYRALLDQAWTALQQTGHGDDTILVGETAPKGLKTRRGPTRAIDALRFVKRLYCVDDNVQVLRGRAARMNGCPTRDQLRTFPARHPALFRNTGWAHHPYELDAAPSTEPSWGDWVTIGNLPKLSDVLRRFDLRYRQERDEPVPLYLTEFGYQTDPPDRFGVSPAEQAAYLNQAEFIAFENPRVRALSQFLLFDDGPPVSRTFQSGLRTASGARKPALDAYGFAIHAAGSVRSGSELRVFGLLRAAAPGSRPRYRIEHRRDGSTTWRRIATRRGRGGRGYLDALVRVGSSGQIRLRSGGRTSRSIRVRVAG